MARMLCRFLAVSTAFLLVAGLVGACGDEEATPESWDYGDGGESGAAGGGGKSAAGGNAGGGAGVLTGACEWGEERECRVYMGDPPGSEGCWVGVQSCFNNEWTECDTTLLLEPN